MDDLVDQLTETFHVDPNALGKAAEQQAKRREEALVRQRDSRTDRFNRLRKLALDEEYEDDEEEVEKQQALDLRKRRPHIFRYADQLMLSEWLIDIPEMLSAEWTMIPAPVGKRVLVVASRGTTTAYNKAGRMVTQFQSRLPGGSSATSASYTIVDAIMSDKTIYCLDLLCWNQMNVADNPVDLRHFLLDSKLEEMPELAVSSKKNKFSIRKLPHCKCTPEAMTEMMSSDFDFDLLDGLLFYYTEAQYEAGQSALVGWLKPWMLPEVLNVPVSERFLAGKEDRTTQQFIESYNSTHGHQSKIEKGMECE
ncbi:unnamed protein product [Caenorhabditis auriculariae]|uniref:Snurportin-1 n=1 Tax=Caenorhabditis auriculariae TaxID=2777116 RepID=A0A8S1HI08_9PELO|nr:unnamed protein product [Caenorhabditis auriculariae]